MDTMCTCPHSPCKSEFKKHSDLVRHVRTHTGEKPFKCSFCEKAFVQKGQRTVHERTHTGEKPYGCRYCGKRMSDRSAMGRHEKIVHQRREQRQEGGSTSSISVPSLSPASDDALPAAAVPAAPAPPAAQHSSSPEVLPFNLGPVAAFNRGAGGSGPSPPQLTAPTGFASAQPSPVTLNVDPQIFGWDLDPHELVFWHSLPEQCRGDSIVLSGTGS